MSTAQFLSKAEFEAKRPQLEALVRDWVDRETTTFDAAVRQKAGEESGGGAIWGMPAIDSKRTTSLLVEMEPLLGCKLPSSLIKRGGYADGTELAADLMPKIEKLCSVAALQSGCAAPTTPAGATRSPRSRVLP